MCKETVNGSKANKNNEFHLKLFGVNYSESSIREESLQILFYIKLKDLQKV